MYRLIDESPRRIYGVAAIEMMAVVAILLVGVSLAVPLFLNKSEVNRENITYKKIVRIKKAITGDTERIVYRTRPSFGFVGDLGVLPGNLTELLEQGGYPNYTTVNNVAYGWHGPYLNDPVDILDAWGRPIRYVDGDGNPATWDRMIYSVGPNGIDENGGGDDIYSASNGNSRINENEVRNFVQGQIQSYQLPHLPMPVSGWQVRAYYPNGSGTLATATFTTTNGGYASNPTLIPIGNRFFEVIGQPLHKIASLNGGGISIVNFITTAPQEEDESATLYERTFWPDDAAADNQVIRTHVPAGGLVEENSSSGYLRIHPNSDGDIYLLQWGQSDWENYRVEVNLSSNSGRYFGIFYRMNDLTYVPAVGPNPPSFTGTGYILEVDLGLSPSSDATLTIKRYESGAWTTLGSPAIVPNSDLLTNLKGNAHQFSVTVNTDGTNTEHNVRIDGNLYIQYVEAGGIPNGSSGLWVEPASDLTMYHLLVHAVPPDPELPFVWWSFEEGPPVLTTYGFGYLDSADTLIGTIHDNTSIYRYGNAAETNRHGQCIYLDGSRDAYIQFGDDLDFAATDAFTISAWVKLDTTAQGYYTIASKKHQGNDRGWIVQLQVSGTGSIYALFNMKQANPAELTVFSMDTLQPGSWNHVIVRYDGTPFSGSSAIVDSAVNIYVTNESANVLKSPPNMWTSEHTLQANSDTTHDSPFIIGSSYITGGRWGGATNPFFGYIDEIMIFDRALSEDEMETLFQRDRDKSGD